MSKRVIEVLLILVVIINTWASSKAISLESELEKNLMKANKLIEYQVASIP